MEPIVIQNTDHKESDLIKILATLCLNIQKDFDIAPQTLSQMINQSNFIDDCHFLYQQCYGEMIRNVDQFKERFNSNTTEITTEEYERCGYPISSHQNNYITYCNVHKYLHPNDNISSVDRYGCGIDHAFVTKNNNQIIKERYTTTIYLLYQNFINKLYCMIRKLFDDVINCSCGQSIVQIPNPDPRVSDNCPCTGQNLDLHTITDRMCTDSTLFKSKIIYEHHNTTEDKHGKFYYVKVYQLHSRE
jgi:hypothetical protein